MAALDALRVEVWQRLGAGPRPTLTMAQLMEGGMWAAGPRGRRLRTR
ncbi:hypothetical protein [Acidiferrobacter sp.]